MQMKRFSTSRTDVYARGLAGFLVLGLWTLKAPTPASANEVCPPANTSLSNIDLVSDASGVNLATEGTIYIGNVFDYDRHAGWEEIELAFFVDPQQFETGKIRVWVHSARRGVSGVKEETLLHDQTLELKSDQVLLPDDIWIDVPFIPSIWVTLPLSLTELVPPCHDLLAIGFVIELEEVIEKRFFPGFSSVGYTSLHEPAPMDSSIFSDRNGDISLGLTWEYLKDRLPEDYPDSTDPRFQKMAEYTFNKVGSTHIRIHVRP